MGVRQAQVEAQKAQAETQELQRRLAKLEGRQLSTRRRSQQSRASSSLVHMHRVNITLHGPGAGYSSGHRRRAQQGCGDVAARISGVNRECCDEPSEDCSSGVPAVCNAGCAAEFLPFWNDCSAQLQNSANFLAVVTLCRAASTGSSSGSTSLAQEFNVVCADGAVDNCAPACSEALHGDLLLMNLDGGFLKV